MKIVVKLLILAVIAATCVYAAAWWRHLNTPFLPGHGPPGRSFQVSFVPLGQEWTNRMNWVWNSNLTEEDL